MQLKSRLLRDLIRGVSFGGSSLIRGVVYGGSGFIRGGLPFCDICLQLGKCDCMMILLEKSRSDGVLESLTVPRLLNMAAEYDQVLV